MAQKSTVVAWWAFCCPNGRKGSLWRACLGLGLLDDILLVIQTCSGSQLWVRCSWWELPFIGRHFPPIRSNVVAFLPPSVFLTDLALYTAGWHWVSTCCPTIYLLCEGPIWWNRAGDENGRHPALTACEFPAHQGITSVCLSWPLGDHFYTLLKKTWQI